MVLTSLNRDDLAHYNKGSSRFLHILLQLRTFVWFFLSLETISLSVLQNFLKAIIPTQLRPEAGLRALAPSPNVIVPPHSMSEVTRLLQLAVGPYGLIAAPNPAAIPFSAVLRACRTPWTLPSVLTWYLWHCLALDTITALFLYNRRERYTTAYLGRYCAVTGHSLSSIVRHRVVAAPFKPAYIVATDDSSSRMSVSVRGTVSLADLITDLSPTPIPYGTGYVHQGVATGALDVWEEIADDVRQFVEAHPNGSIEFVGHSLGAAVAVLLADTARVLHPGAAITHFGAGTIPMISSDAATVKRFEADSVTIVNRADFIPRLSRHNVLRFISSLHSPKDPTHAEKLTARAAARLGPELVVPGRVTLIVHPHPASRPTPPRPPVCCPVDITALQHLHVHQCQMVRDHGPRCYVESWGRIVRVAGLE